jgi:hypothetical protein
MEAAIVIKTEIRRESKDFASDSDFDFDCTHVLKTRVEHTSIP